MIKSFRGFCAIWASCVIVGILCLYDTYIGARSIASTVIYALYILPIIRNPVLAAFIFAFPVLLLYILFSMVVRVGCTDDDFVLNCSLQEAQGLWLGVSLGLFLFFAASATSADAMINRATDISAVASFIPTFILYRRKRREIICLHTRHATKPQATTR